MFGPACCRRRLLRREANTDVTACGVSVPPERRRSVCEEHAADEKRKEELNHAYPFGERKSVPGVAGSVLMSYVHRDDYILTISCINTSV